MVSKQIGLHVEGVGPKSPGSSPADRMGYLWVSETPIPEPSPIDTSGVVNFSSPDLSTNSSAILREDPVLVKQLSGPGDSVQVFENDVSFSGFSIPLVGNDFNVELFRDSERNPAFLIDAPVTKSDSSIDTTATSGELADTVGYVGDETVYFDTHQGGGTYSVERGAYLSSAEYYAQGTAIFLSVPFWDTRKVRLYTFDFSRTLGNPIQLNRFYVGIIDGSNKHDHELIELPTIHYGTSARKSKVNQNPFNQNDLVGHGAGIKTKPISDDENSQNNTYQVEGRIRYARGGNKDGKSHLQKESTYSLDSENPQVNTWLQFNDQMILPYDGTEIRQQTREIIDSFSGSTAQRQPLPFGQTLKQNAPEEINDIWEPFVVSRLFDEREGQVFSATREIEQYSEHDRKFVYHPVSIVACLMMSTYSPNVDAENFDVLHGNWGAGMGTALADSFPSDVRKLVDENPQDEVDRFILGTAGEEVQIWEELKNLLRAYGYHWSVKTNGAFTIRKLTNSDALFYDYAVDNQLTPLQSDILFVDDGEGDIKDVVEGTVGGIEGIEDPQTVQVQSGDPSPHRVTKLRDRSGSTVDLSSVAKTNLSKARKILRNKAALQKIQRPKYSLKQEHFNEIDPQYTGDYSLGAPVTLNRIPLVKKWISRNGKRQRISQTDLIWAARITARRFYPSKMIFELQVEIIGAGLARLRSPSGIVESVDATSPISVTLENKDDGGGEELRGAEPFHVGDEVQFFSNDGSKISSTVFEISSISGDTLELDGGPFNNDPAPGDICEIAYLDTDESGTGFLNTNILANIDRPYVGMADDSSTLGDSGENADIYGAR